MYETGFSYAPLASEGVKGGSRSPHHQQQQAHTMTHPQAGSCSASSRSVHIKVEAAGRQPNNNTTAAPASGAEDWTPGCGYRYSHLTSDPVPTSAADSVRSYQEDTSVSKASEGGSSSSSAGGGSSGGAQSGQGGAKAPSSTAGGPLGGSSSPMHHHNHHQQQQQQHHHHVHQSTAAFGTFRDRYQSAFSNLTPLLGYEKTVVPSLATETARSTRITSENEQTSSRTNDKSVVVPADPSLWSPDHVQQWLDWAVREYSLQEVDATRFTFVGRELCQLTREDFSRLTNPYNGEVLYAHLHFLRQTSEASLPPSAREKLITGSGTATGSASTAAAQPSHGNKAYQTPPSEMHPLKLTKSETTYKGAWSTASSSQGQAYSHNALSGMTKSSLDAHSHIRNMQDPYQVFGPTSSRLASSGSGQIQLWQFLLELLSDSSNANCITWEGTNGEFKLTDPDEVARRWGERKSKPNMNYDKLSRALRYYYDKNIMTKVHGKRYAYKFDFQGLAQATQPAAADPASYKYQSDLFMPSYHHSPKLNFAVGPHAAIPSSTGGIFPSPTSYWSNTSANLYSNIATGHAMPHHAGHVTSHIGSYPPLGWVRENGGNGNPRELCYT